MFEYAPNMYHSMVAKKSSVGESSHLWFLDRGDSRKYVVKMAKTASGSQELVQEYHTNRLYKYVPDKGLGQVCAITVPKVRLAGAAELAELVAIDNVSKKLSREGMANMQRQLNQLTDLGVGGDILGRILETTGKMIDDYEAVRPVYDVQQLSRAGKTPGLGFMQGLIWMRDFIGDEGFEQMREQVDGQASGGIIAGTLSTLNAKGDKTVQHVMGAIAEPD